MKNALLLLLTLPLTLNAQPCPANWQLTVTAQIHMTPQPADPCPFCEPCDSMNIMDLPDTTGLVVFISQVLYPGSVYRFRIVKDCDSVYMDTCIVQPASAPMGYHQVLQVYNDWHGNWQAWTCGVSDEDDMLFFKPGTSHQAPLPFLYSMDTCGVLPYTEPSPYAWEVKRAFEVYIYPSMRLVDYANAPLNQILVTKAGRKIMKQ